MRLDTCLVDKYKIESKNLAQRMISEKRVKVNNKIISKNSFKVDENSKIEIDLDEVYVSRSAYKLKFFLDDFQNIKNSINNSNCLDIGASTGGFTQVLIENGANKVTALDVGTSQLAEKLKNNPKILSLENSDIRNFKSDEKYDIVTCDVSFISLLKILDSIDKINFKMLILLFKPQFEVGKEAKRDRYGVVLDANVVEKAQENFKEYTKKLDWELVAETESKQKGKEGNLEYIYCFRRKSETNHK